MRIKQRQRDDNRFKEVHIKFSDDTSLDQYELGNHADWIEIPLLNGTLSHFVKIIRKSSMRSPDKGGLDRIKVFGCRRGNLNSSIDLSDLSL